MSKQRANLPPLIQRMRECRSLKGVDFARQLVEISTDPDADIINVDAFHVLTMMYIYDMTIAEIAAELDMVGRYGELQTLIQNAVTALRKHQQENIPT